MIVLGIVLLVVGFLLGIHLLWIVGIVLACVGAAAALVGHVGHREIAGRRHWW